MALRIIEGFDHLTTQTSIQTKAWTFVAASRTSESETLTFTSGRINGSCMRQSTPGGGAGAYSTGTVTKSFTAAATAVLGFAFRISGFPASSTEIARIRAAGTNTVRLFLISDGSVAIVNSGGTTIASGAAGIVSAGNWVFLELKAFVNGASGTVQLNANGAAYIASTTVNIGSTNLDSIQFVYVPVSSPSYTPSSDIDDVYVLDTSGSDNTNLLGDVHVETIFPAADGANDAWTADTGTNSADRVDEQPPDGDTSYIYSSTVNQKTTFDMGTLVALTGTVYGVQTNLYARKDDASTRQIAPVVRQGGSDFDGTTVTLALSYGSFPQIYENDPSDSNDWTIGKVNSAEFGVKVIT